MERGVKGMFDQNKRKFKRSATNVHVKFKKEEGLDKKTQQYLNGVAENCGIGGMFIATDTLLEKGSVITLDLVFLDEGAEINVQAKAVVRWIQRFRKPKGMGVEFYDFSGLEGIDFQPYIERLVQKD